MAVKTVVIHTVTSDLSGEEDAETVSFGFEGATYEVDLTAAERETLVEVLNPYLNVARRSGGRIKRGSAAKTASGPTAKDIKAWAVEQGMDVPSRGRLPKAVTDAYAAAH